LDGYGTEWEASGMNFAENLAGKKNAGKERSMYYSSWRIRDWVGLERVALACFEVDG
jgi:hypothetical protein